MEDQVSQNARIERDECRSWAEFTEAEKAAALMALGRHVLQERPWWGQEGAAAVLVSDLSRRAEPAWKQADSPIEWGHLSRRELADRLLEVADWSASEEGMKSPVLRDACLDMVDDLRRGRGMTREGRER
jgi:hypothetical protein